MKKALLILIIALFTSCEKADVKPDEVSDPSCLCNPDDGGNETDKQRGITIKWKKFIKQLTEEKKEIA